MKEQILLLRSKGWTYNQIQEALGCSKSTISYHCGEGQKEKTRARSKSNKAYQLQKNLHSFMQRTQKQLKKKSETPHTTLHSLQEKVRKFVTRGQGTELLPISERSFTFKQFIEKYKSEANCYLTGTPIDIYATSTYHLDHILPISKGGSNNLDNLGITTKSANQSKSDMTLEEYLTLCLQVLVHWGIVEYEENN
jgi:5-methylcytosine-specific restriction endonuclease McrA